MGGSDVGGGAWFSTLRESCAIGLLRSGCGRNNGFSVSRTDDDLRLRPFMGGSPAPEAPDGSEVGNCRLTIARGDGWDQGGMDVVKKCFKNEGCSCVCLKRKRGSVKEWWRVENAVCDLR